MTDPTPAAMRAADELIECMNLPTKYRDRLAELINRETTLPQLLEALRKIRDEDYGEIDGRFINRAPQWVAGQALADYEKGGS